MTRVERRDLSTLRRPWEGREVRLRIAWDKDTPSGAVGRVERWNGSSDVFLVDFGQGGVYVWPEMLDLVAPIQPAIEQQRAVAHGGPA